MTDPGIAGGASDFVNTGMFQLLWGVFVLALSGLSARIVHLQDRKIDKLEEQVKQLEAEDKGITAALHAHRELVARDYPTILRMEKALDDLGRSILGRLDMMNETNKSIVEELSKMRQRSFQTRKSDSMDDS